MKQNGRNHKAARPTLITGDGIDPRSIPIGDLCIVSGILTDTHGTPWINAPWQVDVISPSSPPVYTNGQAAGTMFGNLDATGAFNAYVPRTDFLQPAGCKLRFTIKSVTSAPPLVLSGITIAVATLDLGAELSPVAAPVIHAGPLNYAYTDQEIVNPTNGSGYVNTSENLAFVWQGVQWVPVNSGPSDQIYPPNGVAVSTGSAWAASIPQASIPLLNATLNNFSGAIAASTLSAPTISGTTANLVTLNGQVLNLNNPSTTGLPLITAIQPNLTAGQTPSLIVGHTTASLDGTQIGFYYSGTANTEQGTIGITGGVPSSFDQASNWHLPGTITTAGSNLRIGSRGAGGWTTGSPNINSDGLSVVINAVQGSGSVFLNLDQGAGVAFGDGNGGEVGNIDDHGNAIFDGAIGINNPTTITSGIVATASLMTPNIGVGGSNYIFLGQSNTVGNAIIFGFAFLGSGSPTNRGLIGFAGEAAATFDPSGDWNFPGTVTAAAKSFRIPHPTKAGSDLVHGCIEGPEWAVFYRGESAVIDGEVEVELPDYFEALTRPEGRTVLLTAIYDGENEPGTLAATRVKDGKFTVISSNLGQEFFWEVKAVRRDLEPLETVTQSEAAR